MPVTELVSSIADRTLRTVRVLDAPRDLVWKAWTEPEHFAGWAGCDGTTAPLSKVSMDVRSGGAFNWVMVSLADGDEALMAGTYREVTPSERLVFVRQGTPTDPDDVVVTITLADVSGGRTEMRFQETGFGFNHFEYGLARLREGTAEEIDRLAAYVARIHAGS